MNKNRENEHRGSSEDADKKVLVFHREKDYKRKK